MPNILYAFVTMNYICSDEIPEYFHYIYSNYNKKSEKGKIYLPIKYSTNFLFNFFIKFS